MGCEASSQHKEEVWDQQLNHFLLAEGEEQEQEEEGEEAAFYGHYRRMEGRSWAADATDCFQSIKT